MSASFRIFSPLATHHSSLACQLFFLVLSSTSPVRESSAACVESSDVMPRPITRRPPRVVPEEPEALRADEPDVEPEALRELLLPLFLDRLLPLVLLDRPLALLPLLELLLPPLALIPPRLLPVPPLLRFGMLILR
jgi:hypothetical protein